MSGHVVETGCCAGSHGCRNRWRHGGCSLFFSDAVSADAGGGQDASALDAPAQEIEPNNYELWEVEQLGAIITFDESAVRITPGEGQDGVYAVGGLNSVRADFNFDDGRRVFVEVLGADAPEAGVSLLLGTTQSDVFRIRRFDGKLKFEEKIGASMRRVIEEIDFKPTHRFWQIRRDGDDLLAEAGPELNSLESIGTTTLGPISVMGLDDIKVRLIAEATMQLTLPAVARFGGINTVCQ